MSLVSAGPFAGHTALVLEEAVVDHRRIEAPAGREQGNFLDVGIDSFLHAEGKRLRWIGIIETFEAEFLLGDSSLPLVPKSSPGPRISAENAATIGLGPRMMMEDAAGIEELDATEFATEVEQKTETGIDVVAWFGKARAEDDDPTFDRGRDEKLFISRKALDPRTWFGIMKAEGGLNRFEVSAFDCEP